MKLNNPHDLFFKGTFGNVTVAGDFLTNYLPDSIIKHIDIKSLEPQKDSFIDEKLEETYSDLLFQANIFGEEGYIYFLFEHKSYPDKGIAFQVLRYMVDIWEAKMDKAVGKLPIIIPLVVYHGTANWLISSNLGDMLNGYRELPKDLKAYVPNFNYLLYDVTAYSDEEIKGIAQTKIGLTLLRDIFSANPETLMESFYRSVEYLNELEDQQKGIEYFETMIRYVLGAKTKLTRNDMEEMFEKIGNTFLEGSNLSMSLADILREEGMEKGLEKGRAEGREEGREEGMQMSLAEIANQGLVAKFKKVPIEISNGIEELSIPVLKEIVSKIMRDDGFKNLDEVREYL